MNRATKEVKITLEPEQRFFVETKQDCSLLLVDSITILPECSQINLNGKIFSVDYEDSKIEPCDRACTTYEMNELGTYDA
ncbi:hypothetical protein ACYCSE_17445 [Paenibacillus sp. SEL1]